MMSAFFRGVSSERAGGRRSSRNAAGPGALESWLSCASANDAQELIVAHQTHELWFNQLLCELAVLVADLDADSLPAASRTLERATRIAGVLVEQMRELGALPSGKGHLDVLLGGGTKTDREPLRRLGLIAGTGTAALGRWVARERRPERLRSVSVREAFVRAVAREAAGETDVALSRTPAIEELQAWLAARLARPALVARHELASGLRALDERLVDWARYRETLCHGACADEGHATIAPCRRFFPELWG